jgi:hypothetical protein
MRGNLDHQPEEWGDVPQQQSPERITCLLLGVSLSPPKACRLRLPLRSARLSHNLGKGSAGNASFGFAPHKLFDVLGNKKIITIDHLRKILGLKIVAEKPFLALDLDA